MGLGSPVPCLEVDGGSGWTLWCAVLSKCLFFTTSQVPIFTYHHLHHLSLSLSPPKSFISCSIVSIFLFKLRHFARRGIETLHGAFAVGLELCSFGYVPADRKNVSRWVNGGNLTTGHPHDMIKAKGFGESGIRKLWMISMWAPGI